MKQKVNKLYFLKQKIDIRLKKYKDIEIHREIESIREKNKIEISFNTLFFWQDLQEECQEIMTTFSTESQT